MKMIAYFYKDCKNEVLDGFCAIDVALVKFGFIGQLINNGIS